MTLIVCALDRLQGQVLRTPPARIITLLAPGQAAPDLPPVPRLCLAFHDIDAPRPGLVAPGPPMVQSLLDFAGDWRESGPLLAHCWMGISRSTAAALILACALRPDRSEADAALALRAASPAATPNPLMIAIADDLLGRQGRLIAAAESIGRGAEAETGGVFRLQVRTTPRG
jgi:predicted protein tyrosine phosphatase